MEENEEVSVKEGEGTEDGEDRERGRTDVDDERTDAITGDDEGII